LGQRALIRVVNSKTKKPGIARLFLCLERSLSGALESAEKATFGLVVIKVIIPNGWTDIQRFQIILSLPLDYSWGA
jgi:hypothetical protein